MPDVKQSRIQGELAYDNYTINDLLNSQTLFQNTDETFGLFADTMEVQDNWRLLPAMLQFTKLN